MPPTSESVPVSCCLPAFGCALAVDHLGCSLQAVGNPCTGGGQNQDMRSSMGSGQQMLHLERDARTSFEESCNSTQATCAQKGQDTQTTLPMLTHNTLASYTQTSLATYCEEEEEETGIFHEEEFVRERTPTTLSDTSRNVFNRVPQVHGSSWQRDASSWEHDGYGQQSGLSIRPGCPPNCKVCRFGFHL